MTGDGQHSHGDDGLLRRFNDSNPEHWSDVIIDEGDGSLRLKGGALIWNPDLSVALTSELDRLGITYEDVASDPYLGLAFATVLAVEAFRSGNAMTDGQEFEVLADPQPPPPNWLQAHGLVRQLGDYPSKHQAREARRELGRRIFVPVMISSGKLLDWQRFLGS